MSTTVFEIEQLYNQYFGTKPSIATVFKNDKEPIKADGSVSFPASKKTTTTSLGGVLSEQYLGVEIWLPTTLKFENGSTFYLPYSTIRITGSKSFIRTPLAERKGSVKELFSIDDYKITIKGFFIDKENRVFPEDSLNLLRTFFESNERCFLQNALTDLFMDKTDAVVIHSFELPEVEGGRKHVRPFIMQLESDSVFELIVS